MSPSLAAIVLVVATKGRLGLARDEGQAAG